MIEFLKGKINYIDTQFIVVEVNQIGYQVYCANPFIYQSDMEVTVYTYQHVREDAIKLFGFKTREEKSLFEKLLNVSGIGPKGALAILATGDPSQVIHAIEQENEQFLVKFPGVGKKTARQIILDLKGKLNDLMPSLFSEGIEAKVKQTTVSSLSPQLEEALEALRALGYVEKEIKKVAPVLAEEEMNTDQYIKKGLQLLLKI